MKFLVNVLYIFVESIHLVFNCTDISIMRVIYEQQTGVLSTNFVISKFMRIGITTHKNKQKANTTLLNALSS